jgi:predicted nucleic acid-binding protein
LVDTGPIVGLFLLADQHHTVCRATFSELPPLVTCWPVVAEAAWLLRREPAALSRLLASFGQNPLFELAPLDETDLPPFSAILTKYRDLRVQLADAALLHLANRESIHTIFTLDRRDFEVFRLKNGKRPRLIP